METVSIEKKTFEELMVQWDAFVEKVTALQRTQMLRITCQNLPFFLFCSCG